MEIDGRAQGKITEIRLITIALAIRRSSQLERVERVGGVFGQGDREGRALRQGLDVKRTEDQAHQAERLSFSWDF
jgi:hypothetical protein